MKCFFCFGLFSIALACGASTRTSGGEGVHAGESSGGNAGSGGLEAGGSSGRAGGSGRGGSGGASGNFGLTPDGTVDHGYVPKKCDAYDGEGCRVMELAPNGACICGGWSEPPLDCTNARNECCSDEECTGGRCLSVPAHTGTCCSDSDCVNGGTCHLTETAGGYCFEGEPVDPFNRCIMDECTDDEDCPNGFCAAEGVFPTRTCIEGTCKSHDDCTRRPGGVCTTVTTGCQGCLDRGLQTACVYPGDGCTSAGTCPQGSICDVRDGFAACRPGACTSGD